MADRESGTGPAVDGPLPLAEILGEGPGGASASAPSGDQPREPPAEAAPPLAPEPRKGPIVEHRGGGARRVLEKPVPPAPSASAERTFRRKAPEVAPPEPPPAPELPAPIETETFAELFAKVGSSGRSRLAVGQKVSGRVIQIGQETTFLDLGGQAGAKTEALIDTRELRDDHGTLRLSVGAPIAGYVRSLEDGVWITTVLPKGAQREALAAAREAGMPVDGTVIGTNKGGLEIDLGGGLRGFVPASQATLRFTPDLSGLVGQKLQFLVTQVKDRDIVLSRRALLERETKEKADQLRDTLVVGTQVEGTVTSLREFGAFVDLGGLEGLVPLSEISHRRVANPDEVLKVGQGVTVEVLQISPATPGGKGDSRERITLSLKRLEDDPWMVFGNALTEGQRIRGKVVRLQPFGAFVELSPGVDGLVHSSRLAELGGGRSVHPAEILKEGQLLWVEVETLDRASRKIGLRPLTDEEASRPAPPRLGPPRIGDLIDATVDKVESFGLFVRWPGGRGLLPASEIAANRGGDLRRTHPVGTKTRVQIIDIDAQGRVRLSAMAAVQTQERAEVADYLRDNQPTDGGQGLGTFGDLFKKKPAR